MSEKIHKIEKLITAMGCEIDWIEEDTISVDNCLWQIIINENFPDDISLSLHVEICPWKAADISKRLSYLASLIGMNLVIHDVYAFELNEAGNVVDMTFGDDAYETSGRTHYYGLHEKERK